ncbi:MAG: energy-coupled thiamine transporter ThiT [Saccharofermentanales bacterium]|jgi:thiamine transporter
MKLVVSFPVVLADRREAFYMPDKKLPGNKNFLEGIIVVKTNSSRMPMQNLFETILATAGGGMAIALSTALSLYTLYRMPQGGSITPASMLPIVLYAIAFGPIWGTMAGIVHGLLQFVLAPFTAHWASIVLDYPLAFGCLGLAGLFAAKRSLRAGQKNIFRRLSLISLPRLIAAIWVAMGGRTICHLLSGVVFYRSNILEAGMDPWVYSLVYNGTYMLPEAVITTVLLVPFAVFFRSRRT